MSRGRARLRGRRRRRSAGSVAGDFEAQIANVGVATVRATRRAPSTGLGVDSQLAALAGGSDGGAGLALAIPGSLAADAAASAVAPVALSRQLLAGAKVINQVCKKFVMVRAKGVLLCVDQHAADERCKLEELETKVFGLYGSHLLQPPPPPPLLAQAGGQGNAQGSSAQAQAQGKAPPPQGNALQGRAGAAPDERYLGKAQLSPPTVLQCTALECDLLRQYAQQMQAWNFQYCVRSDADAGAGAAASAGRRSEGESWEQREWLLQAQRVLTPDAVGAGAGVGAVLAEAAGVTGSGHATVEQLPVICGVRLTCADLLTFVHELHASAGSPRLRPSAVVRVLNSKACRSAVKFGDELSLEQSANLLRRLSACSLPFQCAHGRPTMIPLVKLNTRSFID